MENIKEYYTLTKKVFKILSPFYDIVTLPLRGLRDRVVKFSGAGTGSKILDVCTGTGGQAFAFAKAGYEVTGIDISEDMLKVAGRKNKRGNLNFAMGDATKLPFNDNSFDVSSISFALHDMPLSIREKVLKELLKTLGIEIKEELRAVFGFARIIKGIKGNA